jgi:hypothetical protein
MCSQNDHPPYDPPTCDGVTEAFRAGGWGIEDVPCTQQVGLVSWRDYSGQTRRSCVRHVRETQRRYGVMEENPGWLHEEVAP